MRRVGVTLVLAAETCHPSRGTIAVVLVTQIVDVGTLEVCECAKETLLLHGERGLVEGIVAAVLEHEAMAACALGRVDQLPALVNCGSCRYLDGYMLALFHSIACHEGVGEPVSTYIYEVYIVSLTQLTPPFRGSVVLWMIAPISSKQCIGLFQMSRSDVTERHDVYIIDDKVAAQGGHATIAQADESYADLR